MSSESGASERLGERLARSRALGLAWLFCVGLLLVAAFQEIAGGPIRIAHALPAFAPGVVFQESVPQSCPRSRWYNADLRVTAGGQELPLYRSRDALGAAGADGFAVLDKRLYLYRTGADPAGTGRWVLHYPWVPQWWELGALALGVCWWGAGLHRGNMQRMVCACFSARGWQMFGLALCAVAFVSAIVIRCVGFSYPTWANDTTGHYRSVFAVALGGRPLVTPDRPFGLALVMGPLLRWVPDFRAVVAAQGFAMWWAATAVGLTVWLAARRLWPVGVMRALAPVFAVAAFAAIALNEAVLEAEWWLLAECWLSFYLGTQALLAWYLTARARPLGWLAGAYLVFCVAGFLAFFTRPNWGLALAVLPVPWVVATLLYTPRRRRLPQLALGALIVIAVALVTFGYQRQCSENAGTAGLYERARALVCWHVPLVRLEIERRLAATPADPDRPVLSELDQVFARELERSGKLDRLWYPSIGYDADNLYWTGLPSAPRFASLPVEQRTTLCFELFKGALLRHPGMYLAKLVRQAGIFLTRPYSTSNISITHVTANLADSRAIAATNKEIPPQIAENYRRELDQAALALRKPWPSPARLSMSLREVFITDWLNETFGLALGLALVVIAAAASCRPWREVIPWGRYVPVFCVAGWSLASIVLSALSAALMQGLDVQRYLDLFLPLTVLCHVTLPLLTLALLMPLAAKWRWPDQVKNFLAARWITALPLTVLAVLAMAGTVSATLIREAHVKPTLFLVGDSTVNAGNSDSVGWGTELEALFDKNKIDVRNEATPGRSARSYLREGRWSAVLQMMRAGDFVLIQFGHNDFEPIAEADRVGALPGVGEETSSAKGAETVHTYGWYLRRYLADARAKGATAIVCSPVPQNVWDGSHVAPGVADPQHWSSAAATQGGAIFIDLNALVARRWEELGRAKVQQFFAPGEITHALKPGATLAAECLADALRADRECGLGRYLKGHR